MRQAKVFVSLMKHVGLGVNLVKILNKMDFNPECGALGYAFCGYGSGYLAKVKAPIFAVPADISCLVGGR